MKSKSNLLIIGVTVLVLVIGYAAFRYIQYSGLENDLEAQDQEISKLESEILKIEGDFVGTIAAKETIDNLQTEGVKWSKVLAEINKTVPKKTGKSVVDILSYSGAQGNDITMSIKTREGSADPYMDVADLIAAFDDSTAFVSNFVPSISTGINEDGEEILSFMFNSKYMEAQDEVFGRVPR